MLFFIYFLGRWCPENLPHLYDLTTSISETSLTSGITPTSGTIPHLWVHPPPLGPFPPLRLLCPVQAKTFLGAKNDFEYGHLRILLPIAQHLVQGRLAPDFYSLSPVRPDFSTLESYPTSETSLSLPFPFYFTWPRNTFAAAGIL